MRIATRASALARWQATHVASQLEKIDIPCELVPLTTQGDAWLAGHLADRGGKGLFVKELEQALLDGRADIAVHSLKDVPVQIHPQLPLLAYLPRENYLDALIGAESLDSLQDGTSIGTSSLRRAGQLTMINPSWKIGTLRGNVQRRLAKVHEGQFTATLLAAAGLTRLGLTNWHPIDAQTMLPAIGQGVMVVQASNELSEENRQAIATLHCPITSLAACCERAVAATLGGGCHMPLAALAVVKQDSGEAEPNIHLQARVMDLQGGCLEISHSGSKPETLGNLVASKLQQQGAADYFARAMTIFTEGN